MNMHERHSGGSEIADILAREKTSGRNRLWRRLVLLCLLVVVIAAGGFWYWTTQSASSQVRYTTEPVTRGDVTVTVTATGTVQPTNQVDISSELSGIVRDVAVDYNDEVTVGEVLATLDTDKLAAEVAHARATLTVKQAALSQGRATVEEKQRGLERAQHLVNRDVGTQQALDTAQAENDRAKAAIESAEADIEVAKADLQIAETNLEKAKIVSPINGIVLDRGVDPGQYVASSLQAPVLFTVAEDLKQMELLVDIDEADVGHVKPDQAATFTVDAYAGRSFPAKIRQLRYAPVTSEGVVTYKAELSVDNADLLLRPGMTATADIVIDGVKDGLLVPNAALRFTPPSQEAESSPSIGLSNLFRMRPPRIRSANRGAGASGPATVYVLRNGAPVAVPVKTGLSDGLHTQIVSGELKDGDQVVVDARTGGR